MKYLNLITFALSILLTFLIAPLRSSAFGSLQTSGIVGVCAFFLLTFLILRLKKQNNSANKLLFSIFIGLAFFQIPIRLFYFTQTLITLPDFLLHLIGFIFGFLYWRLRTPFNILTTILGVAITLFIFFQGYDLWVHKLNFGTFTGKITAQNLPAPFEAFNEQRVNVSDIDFQNKIILLDFWNTTCGVCFEKFPQVQTAYDKYKNDASVMILAVNSPIEEDKPNQAFEDIRQEGHTFPVVVAKNADLAEKFGVKGYPTTFVINLNGQIIYKGSIEGAVKMVDELKLNFR